MTDTEGFEQNGETATRLVEEINPEAYAEYQLREAISEAKEKIGTQRTKEIIQEEAA